MRRTVFFLLLLSADTSACTEILKKSIPTPSAKHPFMLRRIYCSSVCLTRGHLGMDEMDCEEKERERQQTMDGCKIYSLTLKPRGVFSCRVCLMYVMGRETGCTHTERQNYRGKNHSNPLTFEYPSKESKTFITKR